MIKKTWALWVGLCLAGCQSYQAEPLALREHIGARVHQDPEADGVVAFAKRLREEAGRSGALDLSDGVSLHEAEAMALFYNTKLRVMRSRAGVARARAKHAGAWDDPRLDGELLRFNHSMPNRWISSVGVQFTIPISGRLDVERDQAASALSLAQWRVLAAEWQVLGQLQNTWIRWRAMHQEHSLLKNHLVETRRLIDKVQKLADAGEADPAELGALQIHEATHGLALGALQTQMVQGRQSLLWIMGMDPGAGLKLVPEMAGVEKAAEGSVDPLLGHPDLLVAKGQYELAEQNLRREIHKQYPDLDIGPVFEREEGQSRIGLSAGIPIPSINLNRKAIAEAKAQRDTAKVEAYATHARLSHALASARLEAASAHRRLDALTERMAPVVDRQRLRLKKQIEIGELEVWALGQALASDLKLKQDLLAANASMLAAQARINALVDPRWKRPLKQTESSASPAKEMDP